MYILCTTSTCVDPEGFVSGGATLTTFLGVDERIQILLNYKRAIADPPAKRHLNGGSLACR